LLLKLLQAILITDFLQYVFKAVKIAKLEVLVHVETTELVLLIVFLHILLAFVLHQANLLVLTATYLNALLFALLVDFALLLILVIVLVLDIKDLLVSLLFAVQHAKEELALVQILAIVTELVTSVTFVKFPFALEIAE